MRLRSSSSVYRAQLTSDAGPNKRTRLTDWPLLLCSPWTYIRRRSKLPKVEPTAIHPRASSSLISTCTHRLTDSDRQQSAISLAQHWNEGESVSWDSTYYAASSLSVANGTVFAKPCNDYGFGGVYGCPHDIITCRASGKTTWNPDPINIATSRAAVANFRLKHLENDSMVRKFSDNPQQWLINLRVLCGDRWSLDANQLALVRELGIIGKMPNISEDEISDLNKSDLFVKVLAASQILWLCVQLVTRLKRGIPTTQLEIVTLAFAVVSIITYGLIYRRPKDVETVREIYASRYPTPDELTRIANWGPQGFGTLRQDIAISNNAISWTNGNHFHVSTSASLIVFGGLHLVAWNYRFPTQVEKILWRASIIITLSVYPSGWMLERLVRKTLEFRRLGDFIFYMSAIACGVARIFILIEVIRSLAYQSPEAFRTTWTANIPHVG